MVSFLKFLFSLELSLYFDGDVDVSLAQSHLRADIIFVFHINVYIILYISSSFIACTFVHRFFVVVVAFYRHRCRPCEMRFFSHQMIKIRVVRNESEQLSGRLCYFSS